MKYIILICFTLSLWACKNNGGQADKNTQDTTSKVIDTMKLDSINPGIRRFEMEKGIMEMISYYSGQLLFKKTIYFDRYGARLVLVDNRGYYVYEMNGFHYDIHGKEKPMNKEKMRLEDNYDPQMLNAMLMSDEVKKKVSWSADGEEEILGLKCQKYKCHEGFLRITTEVWLYKGFPIRVQNTDPKGDVSITECKTVKENANIDSKIFELPSWVKK